VSAFPLPVMVFISIEKQLSHFRPEGAAYPNPTATPWVKKSPIRFRPERAA